MMVAKQVITMFSIFRIHALHSEFKEVEQSHAVEIRHIRDELESLR